MATVAAVLRPGLASSAGSARSSDGGRDDLRESSYGADANPGTKKQPLRTLAGGAHVNTNDGVGPMTIVLSEVSTRSRDDIAQAEAPFVLGDGAVDHPREVSRRPEWHTADATLVHTMPVPTRGMASRSLAVRLRHDDRNQPVDNSGLKISACLSWRAEAGIIRRFYASAAAHVTLED